MAFRTGQVTATTSAGALVTNVSGDSSDLHLHVDSGGQAVFMGASDVTTSTGIELEAGDDLDMRLDHGETLYVIVGATTQVVSYIIQD